LAFILIVFALSMTITAVVQIWLEIRGARRKALQRMLNAYFYTGLIPAVRRRIGNANWTAPPNDKGDFDLLVAGSASTSNGSSATEAAPDLVTIDTEAFVARLRMSNVGQDIATQVRAHERQHSPGIDDEKVEGSVKDFFDELGARFDAFGDKASELFRRRAFRASVGFGILLAFAADIDAVRVLKVFISDPAARTAILTAEQELLPDLKALRKEFASLGDLRKSVDKVEAERAEVETIAARFDAAAESQYAPILKDLKNGMTALKTTNAALPAKLEKLDGLEAALAEQTGKLDVAIASAEISGGGRLGAGWSTSPFCRDGGGDKNGDGQDDGCSGGDMFLSGLLWAAGCIIMGLLASFGAPFWYDLVKSMAQARKTGRNPASAAA
jgi:hypothetical protein